MDSFACPVCGNNCVVREIIDQTNLYEFDWKGDLIDRDKGRDQGDREVQCSHDPTHDLGKVAELLLDIAEDVI